MHSNRPPALRRGIARPRDGGENPPGAHRGLRCGHGGVHRLLRRRRPSGAPAHRVRAGRGGEAAKPHGKPGPSPLYPSQLQVHHSARAGRAWHDNIHTYDHAFFALPFEGVGHAVGAGPPRGVGGGGCDGVPRGVDQGPARRGVRRGRRRHRQGTSHTTRLGPSCSYRTLALLPVLRGLFSLIRVPPPTFSSTPHRCCARPTSTR